jgi:hypothetical protein
MEVEEKHKIIDGIVNEIAWAIDNLVNPKPYPLNTADPSNSVAALKTQHETWTETVTKKLADRNVFNQGDQTLFDHLGFIQVVNMTQNLAFDHLLSTLNLQLDRLREIERRARERITNVPA